MSSPPPSHDEDSSQLSELDSKRGSLRHELLQVRSNLTAKTKLKRRSELCKNELNELPRTAVTYKAVGRMFLMTPLASLESELDGLIASSSSEIANAENAEKRINKEIEQVEKAREELDGKQVSK
jgi:chaperonin cofactor prefoldin